MNAQLTGYIEKKRAAGVSDEQIVANLVAAGWPANIVHDTMDEQDIPRPPVDETPRHAFTAPADKIGSRRYGGTSLLLVFLGVTAAMSLAGLLNYVISSFGVSDGLADVASVINHLLSGTLVVSLAAATLLFFRLHAQEVAEPRITQSLLHVFSLYVAICMYSFLVVGAIAGGIITFISHGEEFNLAITVARTAAAVIIFAPLLVYYVQKLRAGKRQS